MTTLQNSETKEDPFHLDPTELIKTTNNLKNMSRPTKENLMLDNFKWISKRRCENGTLSKALIGFLLKLVESNELEIADTTIRQSVSSYLTAPEATSTLEKDLRIFTHPNEAFYTFCSFLEVPNGEFITNKFKIHGERYAVLVETRTNEITDILATLKYEISLPPYVWITLGSTGPLIAPGLQTTLAANSPFVYSLKGVIFDCGGDYNYYYRVVEDWVDIKGLTVATAQLVQVISMSAVYLYYQADPVSQVLSEVESVKPIVRPNCSKELSEAIESSECPAIRLSNSDIKQFESIFNGISAQLSKWEYANVNDKDKPVSITQIQRLAKFLLNDESPGSFFLTQDQYDELVNRIRKGHGSKAFATDVTTSSSKRNCLKLERGKLYDRTKNLLCPRCLKVSENVDVGGYQYCWEHYPKGSVEYIVMLDTNDQVILSVSPIPGRSKYINYRKKTQVESVCNHKYVVSTLQEANHVHCTLILGLWIKSIRFGRHKNRKMWLNKSMVGDITQNSELAMKILKKFGVSFKQSPLDSVTSKDWSREKAFKYGFIFEKYYKLRSIYKIVFDTPSETVVYVGKNAEPGSIVNPYKRSLKEHLYPNTQYETQIVVNSPSQDFIDYLESVIQAVFCIASVCGLKENGKSIKVSNYMLERLKFKPGPSCEEYLNLFLNEYFGVNMSLTDVSQSDSSDKQ